MLASRRIAPLSAQLSVPLPAAVLATASSWVAALVLLLVFCFAAGGVAAQDDQARTDSQDRTEQIDRFTRQVESLESEFGPFDSRLLEPLAGLSRLYVEAADYERAAALLRRQLQLTRNTFGFEDLRVLPVLDELIRTEVARGQWQQVADYLELRSQLFVTAASAEQADRDAQLAFVAALTQQSSWLVQQLALTPTRQAVRTFFDAREVEERIADLSDEALDSDQVDLQTLRRWLPVAYRQAYSDYALVQLLNARSGFSYDTIDYLTRREGGNALHKLSSPGFAGRTVSANNRIPILERGDPIGIGYLRDGYFRVRRMDDQFEETIEAMRQAQASPAEIAAARRSHAMVKLVRGDFQILQNRGSGVREYRDAQALLAESGVSQELIDSFFSRPTPIPAQSLTLDFDAALAALPEGECLNEFSALSERLATLARPLGVSEGEGADATASAGQLALALPEAEFLLRFNVSRRGRATGTRVEQTSSEDAGLRRAAMRALKTLQFRPAFENGRTRRVSDVCMLFKLPDLEP